MNQTISSVKQLPILIAHAKTLLADSERGLRKFLIIGKFAIALWSVNLHTSIHASFAETISPLSQIP